MIFIPYHLSNWCICTGPNVSSTPWIGDLLDDDHLLDIVYATMGDSTDVSLTSSIHVCRLSTQIPITQPVRWGAYMGSRYNGVFAEETVK